MRCGFGPVLLLGLAACAPASPGAEAEVAAELRALRQVLVARPQGEPRSAADVAAALAPLRQALEALTDNQQELQQRQLALTQELQRWSALLVENAAGARREETEALAARLRQLEASLQAQDARHREMETLLQGALDRTADRLGAFLQAVGAEVEPGTAPADASAPPAVESRQPAQPPEPPVPAGGGASATATHDGAAAGAVDDAHADRDRWQGGATVPWWWAGVGLLGILVGAVCLRRWQRAAAAGAPARAARAPTGATAPDPAPAADPGVQEIWAAAALLGEAVGRLRDRSSGAPATEDDGLDDDLIVLDDELLSPAPAATAAPAAPAAAPMGAAVADDPAGTRALPVAATCRLRTADPARSLASVLQILQEDPRVLRRPEPAVRCARDCLEASFRLVPDLPPGERSHLEQRLRDACGTSA